MPTLRQETETSGYISPIISAICLALIIGALVSSLFFQKVNAEFFALSGLSLIAAFVLALWSGRCLRVDKNILPLLFIFLFWGWIGVATLFSPVTFISLGTFWTIAFLPFTALSVAFFAGNSRVETAAKAALFVIIGALAVYACVKFFVFDSPPRATFANKNNFAALQMPMVFYAAVASVVASRNTSKTLFLALTALFIFTIGIIGSRAVLICLVIGLALIFLFLLMDRWPKKPIVALLATVLVALMASNSVGSGALVKRAETMLSPSSASNDRMVIWEGSLELAKDTPWHGIGPGLFPMVYPKYRLNEDKSAAFFVHNDYLQFFIEAGWPAPLLLLIGFITLAILGFGRILGKDVSPDQKLALLAPLLGFGAIAGHSLLSFNLFLPSLLIMLGILLGLITYRLQTMGTSPTAVAAPEIAAPILAPISAPMKVPRLLCLTIIALSVIPSLFFMQTGRGALFHKEAMALSDNQQFSPAIAMLNKAANASPDADIYHYSLAWLWFRKVSSEGVLPDTQELKAALARLDKAEQLNPLRPQVHVIRARMLQALGRPGVTDTKNNQTALLNTIETEYRKALTEDPFYLEARFYLARFLLQQNRLKEGQAVLEQGIEKPYAYNELSVNYYRLTAEIRRILGDPEGYQRLMSRLQEAIEKRGQG
jgi:O-antigen ligase